MMKFTANKNPVLISNARLLDPAAGTETFGALFVEAGRMAACPAELPPNTEIIDADGLTVTPGLIDVHVHLREPGGEAQETIETGTRSCAKGGFTTLVSMPNTQPPADSPAVLQMILQKAEAAGYCRVLPSACFTAGRTGAALSDLAALKTAGAVIFTDDGATSPDAAVMRAAMQQIAALNLVLMDHAQDPAREKPGVMHEGEYSKRFNLPGIPAAAEDDIVARDLQLAEETGCRVHIQHITSGRAARLVRNAQQRGVPASCEVTPHHLLLCDADVQPDNPNFKMNPPLRSAQDREALLEAVCDGTASLFATDHAPHTAAAKNRGFIQAPFGVIGSETAVGATYTLVEKGVLSEIDWLRRWTCGPAELLNRPAPSLQPGAPADLVLLDLASPWTFQAEEIVSKSKNSPFIGWTFHARAVRTLLAGRTVWPNAASGEGPEKR
jgi:dihydroorotase